MIETSEIKRFECVWFVTTSRRSDLLCVLYQKYDDVWEMKYRFRYYDGSTDDDDTKSWYLMTFKQGMTVAEMESNVDGVVTEVFRAKEMDVKKIEVRGDATKFVEVMAQQEFVKVHVEGAVGDPS
jgi:CDP-glycerol glycerophosphotransferase (TagB/SpsB family)